MTAKVRLNHLEKKVSIISKPDEPIWVCICGERPCVCTKEHRQHSLGSECSECKVSNHWVFMRGNESMGSPIVDPEDLPRLLELVRRGELPLPIPILGDIRAE